MNQQTVYTFAKWQVQQGNLPAVLHLLAEAAAKTKAEPGNILYHMYQSSSDANTLVLYEAYTSAAALQAHRDSPHFQHIIIGQIVPMLLHREVTVTTQLEPASTPGIL